MIPCTSEPLTLPAFSMYIIVILQRLTFRWIFIPWLQVELDAYRSRVNSSRKRRDRNKILPHGVPDHIAEFPHLYGVLDFKVVKISLYWILHC